MKGKMPKDSNQLENRTFAEIENAMKNCHWKIQFKGQILRHLINSFKLLRSQTYVNVSIMKANGARSKCDNYQTADDIYNCIEKELKKIR